MDRQLGRGIETLCFVCMFAACCQTTEGDRGISQRTCRDLPAAETDQRGVQEEPDGADRSQTGAGHRTERTRETQQKSQGT